MEETSAHAGASVRDYRDSDEDLTYERFGKLIPDGCNDPQSILSSVTFIHYGNDTESDEEIDVVGGVVSALSSNEDHDSSSAYPTYLPVSEGDESDTTAHTDVEEEFDPAILHHDETTDSPASSNHPSGAESSETELSSNNELLNSSFERNQSLDELDKIDRVVDKAILIHKLLAKRPRSSASPDEEELVGAKRRKNSDSPDHNALPLAIDEQKSRLDESTTSESENTDGQTSSSEADEGFEENGADTAGPKQEDHESDGYEPDGSQDRSASKSGKSDDDTSGDGDISASDAEGDSFGSCFLFRRIQFSFGRVFQVTPPGCEFDSDGK